MQVGNSRRLGRRPTQALEIRLAGIEVLRYFGLKSREKVVHATVPQLALVIPSAGIDNRVPVLDADDATATVQISS